MERYSMRQQLLRFFSGKRIVKQFGFLQERRFQLGDALGQIHAGVYCPQYINALTSSSADQEVLSYSIKVEVLGNPRYRSQQTRRSSQSVQCRIDGRNVALRCIPAPVLQRVF